MKLSEKLKNYKIKKTKKRIDFSYQALGIELQKYFKTNTWWMFHKYPENKIRDAFKVCKERGVNSIGYLIGIIKNK